MSVFCDVAGSKIALGDCLKVMKAIPDGSVDMVLCDLPYGTTACKWDSVIPFEPLWEQYTRITKPSSAIVLTAQAPFDKALAMSNINNFRHEWIWEKTEATGHLNAKKMPMKAHENVLVFYRQLPVYNPQKTSGHKRKTAMNVDRAIKQSECYGAQEGVTHYDSTQRYPRSVLQFSTDKQKSNLHPTQKPVALMEYLIRTYTNEGDIVLDNCMGSGTTGVACINTGRNFIGVEKEANYYEISKKRLISLGRDKLCA